MLLKNKLNELDEDTETEDIDISKNVYIDISKTEDINNTETENIDNTETEDVDISKNAYIDIGKSEDIDNTETKDKDEDIDRGRNTIIQVFQYVRQTKDRKGNQKIRQIVWVFQDDCHVSELCEKWVYNDGNYAYTRFGELRKRSGEVIFTGEYKTTASKDNVYIVIDKLSMFKDFSIKDMITLKTKNMLDKMDNKISTINKTNEGLAKLKAEVRKKFELIYAIICELQDEIYSNDPQLRLAELEKIDVIIDEAVYVPWKVFYENKKRINPETVEIDKHEDIDGYVSELTDLINHRIGLVNEMVESLDQVMGEIKNEANMIDEKIYKVSEIDNDTIHWIDIRLNNIMTRSRKKSRLIIVQQI